MQVICEGGALGLKEHFTRESIKIWVHFISQHNGDNFLLHHSKTSHNTLNPWNNINEVTISIILFTLDILCKFEPQTICFHLLAGAVNDKDIPVISNPK